MALTSDCFKGTYQNIVHDVNKFVYKTWCWRKRLWISPMPVRAFLANSCANFISIIIVFIWAGLNQICSTWVLSPTIHFLRQPDFAIPLRSRIRSGKPTDMTRLRAYATHANKQFLLWSAINHFKPQPQHVLPQFELGMFNSTFSNMKNIRSESILIDATCIFK